MLPPLSSPKSRLTWLQHSVTFFFFGYMYFFSPWKNVIDRKRCERDLSFFLSLYRCTTTPPGMIPPPQLLEVSLLLLCKETASESGQKKEALRRTTTLPARVARGPNRRDLAKERKLNKVVAANLPIPETGVVRGSFSFFFFFSFLSFHEWVTHNDGGMG